MKLKRCFKTVLSSLLAAAMIVTAAPAGLSLSVQAAPTDETVPDAAQVTEENTVIAETTEPGEGTVTAAAVDTSTGWWGPTIDSEGKVTLYYYGTVSEGVKVKGGWDTSWADLCDMVLQDDGGYAYTLPLEKAPRDLNFEYGYEADGEWSVDNFNPNTKGNSKIVRNPQADTSGNVTLYYYPETHGAYPTVKVKYRAQGSTGDYQEVVMTTGVAPYTKVLTAQISGLADGTYEYVLDVNGAEKEDLNRAAGDQTFTVSSYPQPDGRPSPEINGKEVTFHYYAPTASSVKLAGSMNDSWGYQSDMVLDSETGYFSFTKTVSSGEYQYKFVADGNWITDPLNTNPKKGGNSTFVVAGLEDAKAEVIVGSSVDLPKTLKCYDGTSTAESVGVANEAVTYALSEETAAKEWAEKVTLAEADGITTLKVAADLPAEVTEFTLTAEDKDDHTSVVTVTVVNKVYNYTIYYYDEEHGSSKDNAALWIWENEGAGGVLYDFTAEEVLSDGNTWLKAEVPLSYTDLRIIPKNSGATWDWQDGARAFTNEAEDENVTLYIVYGDGTKIYTALPEVKPIEKNYLVVEYERNDGSAQDWYLYTWNSGLGNAVYVPFEAADDKWIATVPVKRGLESISYCIEKEVDGEHWASKDGNDYVCPMPVDQKVVKIKMEEGKGITYTYPYNKGYEIDVKNKTIHFYFRDDDVFIAGSEGGYDSVSVEIDGQKQAMVFNPDAQRYEYDFVEAEGLQEKDYLYRYELKNGESTSYALDLFNEKTTIEEEIEYSVCTYELFDVDVKAEMYFGEMDYNDNNVLSVSFEGADGADISEMEVVAATADLTEVGFSADTAIDTQLLELSIAVGDWIEAGTKTIPVTVFDQYNNKYTAEATVEVVNRNKGNDFDWDEAVIYFAVTDRFFDGNKSNNGKGYNTNEATGGSSYHGGDFKGLTQKLDYLQDLGVNTIWITPIVANDMAEGLTTPEGLASWGYHGYWASNFEKLDSHLGTEREFKALLDAAHKRGMKIMVDVVLNHAGYNNEEYFNNILKDEEGNPVRMIREGDEIVIGDDKKNPLSDLPDFLTENPEVRDLLVEWQSNWVSKYDIDYYRVDTVKHVDDTTWSAFKNALTKIDPEFKMIGEWAGAGYATDTGMLYSGRMDSLLDFDFNNEATKFVNGDIAEVESFLTARNDAIDNTASLGAFIGSHDEDGFAYKLVHPESGTGVSEEQAMALTKVAASLQITAKGQTVIYYGEEIGMTGANNYPYQDNRYDFDWSLVNDDNDMLAHYKKLLSIRDLYSEVFAKGDRTTIEADDVEGYDVFKKEYGGIDVYTALNINDSEKEVIITGFAPNTYVKDLYSLKLYRTDASGKVTISIPAAADGGTAVLVESDTDKLFYVDAIEDQTYTGNAVTLDTADLKVWYGTTLLEAGKDYKVSYKNNKTVGTATVTVTGIGNYEGKETASFNIVAKNLADSDVTITMQTDLIETGKALKPLTAVTYNGKKLGTKDYTVSYNAIGEEASKTPVKDVKTAGKYEMIITAVNKNFTGSVTKEFTVYAKADTLYMKAVNIELEYTTHEYTGAALKPTVTVTKKDSTKIASDAYKVTYDNNTDIGKAAKVTITGVPAKGLIGTVEKTFAITGTDISKVAEVDLTNWKTEVTYDVITGSAVQTNVTLKAKAGVDAEILAEDYTVSYQKNDKPGTATMLFTGKGKYTGIIKKTFKVTKAALEKDDIFAGSTAVYLKKGSKVDVIVSLDEIILTEGKDYKLTFKNNKAVTTENMADNKKPSVTITGMGAFSGSVTKYFTIVPSDIDSLNVSVADVAYQNKKGKYISVPVVTEADGTKLVNNKDFTCTYLLEDGTSLTKNDVVDADEEVCVTITAKGPNYVGETSKRYLITVQDLSKAKVTVKAQVYTGEEIKLDASDFTIKVGDTTLKEGKHYYIDEDSYKNNTDKGTASVTIVGMGNYGGKKTVDFKITGRAVAWWWNLLH